MNSSILLSVFYDLLKGQQMPVNDLSRFWLDAIVFSVVMAFIALAIVWIIADRTPYQRGANPKDASIRRFFFYSIGVISWLALFYLLFFKVGSNALDVTFFQINPVFVAALIVEASTYFVVGFLLSKIFKYNKFGTIFPTKIKKQSV
jgi:hypothetical protein